MTTVITCLTHGTQKTPPVAAAVEEDGREEVHHCLILLMIPDHFVCSLDPATYDSRKLAHMRDMATLTDRQGQYIGICCRTFEIEKQFKKTSKSNGTTSPFFVFAICFFLQDI